MYRSLLKISHMPKRIRPEKITPTPPEKDVAEKQSRDHSEDDFLRDLSRAATNRSAEKLADLSGPDRGSNKT